MVNYIQSYIPHLTELRIDMQWVWNSYQEEAVMNIIAQIKQSPGLRYYDKKYTYTSKCRHISEWHRSNVKTRWQIHVVHIKLTQYDIEKNQSNIHRKKLLLLV